MVSYNGSYSGPALQFSSGSKVALTDLKKDKDQAAIIQLWTFDNLKKEAKEENKVDTNKDKTDVKLDVKEEIIKSFCEY